MTKVLIIRSSAGGVASVSNQLIDQLVADWGASPADIAVRDLDETPIPHLTSQTLGALKGSDASEAEVTTRGLSDALVAELQGADVLVIGAPMYNFGIPSTLKAWFDHVLRAGVTFRYGATGPEGLVTGKRVVVIETRGGVYTAGAAAVMDAQEPHLRTMLGFIGLTDVTFVRAEGLAMDAAAGIAAARAALPSAVLGLLAAA